MLDFESSYILFLAQEKDERMSSRRTWVSLALINASYFSLPGNHKHFSQTSQGILTVLAVCWVPDSISPSYSHHLLSILLVTGHFIEKQMSPPLISHSDLRRKDIFLNIYTVSSFINTNLKLKCLGLRRLEFRESVFGVGALWLVSTL